MLKFRKTTEADHNKLAEWIAADPDHREKGDPSFWLPQNPEDKIQTFAVQDEEGDIFFVRGENCLRLHIQFAPASEKRRLAKAISEFSDRIAQSARHLKYTEIIFESVFKPLVRFLTNSKRGFQPSPNEFVKDLSIADQTDSTN